MPKEIIDIHEIFDEKTVKWIKTTMEGLEGQQCWHCGNQKASAGGIFIKLPFREDALRLSVKSLCEKCWNQFQREVVAGEPYVEGCGADRLITVAR